jgi:hypothetical protein
MLDYATQISINELNEMSLLLDDALRRFTFSFTRERDDEDDDGAALESSCLFKVVTVLNNVALVTTIGSEYDIANQIIDDNESNDDDGGMLLLTDLDQPISSMARRMSAQEQSVLAGVHQKIKHNSNTTTLVIDINEEDLGGVMPPQTVVGWMLGYPIAYFYKPKDEDAGNVAARKISLMSLVKVEYCCKLKEEEDILEEKEVELEDVVYGFTYPEILQKDLELKNSLAALNATFESSSSLLDKIWSKKTRKIRRCTVVSSAVAL